MVSECGVKNHEWVKDLYSKKLSWATAYIRGRFFASIKTTFRCESLHAKLGRFVDSRYGILEFITNFQWCMEFLRDNEDKLEFRSSYGTPVIQTEFPELEKSGAINFTREIFARYREMLKSRVDDTEALYRNRVGAFLQYCKSAGVRDPIGVRTKRTGHSNEPAGSRAVKLRKCNTCGCLGHRRTRCPNGPQVATSNMEKDTVPSQIKSFDVQTNPTGSESNSKSEFKVRSTYEYGRAHEGVQGRYHIQQWLTYANGENN
ncbi:hypothetical protein AHAS_Ahas19G0219100 [Arachis hypogaea]